MEIHGVHLRQVGRAGTQSLPNIALPCSRVPEIQVSTEETAHSSRKSSTESREFWEETTQLLQELNILREDVSEIQCPCRKPGCPFKHDRTARTVRRNPAATTNRMRSSTMSGIEERINGLAARKNVARYLDSMKQHPQQQQNDHPLRGTARAFRLPQDTLVTEEPLAIFNQDYFIRSAPSRRAQRRHSTAMRPSNSYPITMNNLAVPFCLDLRYEKWCSLPDGMDRQLGNSLDSLDSEKMQDIQKSHQRRQTLHLSTMELDQW